MRWLDIFGAPGVGKSTLVDDLWPPRCIEPDGERHPDEWGPFFQVAGALMAHAADHPSYAACMSMWRRSLDKMATVHRMRDERVYIQTGFAQRGLGIGWRLKDPEMIAAYFKLMPVSLGVVSLHADVETIQRRNRERGKDRSHMVPLMERPRQIAVQVLRARGVPVLELNTVEPVAANVERIVAFADRHASAA